jgi:hypothetical protein
MKKLFISVCLGFTLMCPLQAMETTECDPEVSSLEEKQHVVILMIAQETLRTLNIIMDLIHTTQPNQFIQTLYVHQLTCLLCTTAPEDLPEALAQFLNNIIAMIPESDKIEELKEEAPGDVAGPQPEEVAALRLEELQIAEPNQYSRELKEQLNALKYQQRQEALRHPTHEKKPQNPRTYPTHRESRFHRSLK